MEIERPKSDDEYLDQCLKTILEENVDKVSKVFIPMKHYFHFTLIVWTFKNEKTIHAIQSFCNIILLTALFSLIVYSCLLSNLILLLI